MVGSPRVWSKFSAKTKDGTILNLGIVDMPKSLCENVINLYINHFVKEENTIIASGVPQSIEAMEELRRLILGAVNEEKIHIVICCLDDGDDQIKEVIGASLMSLTSKGDPEPKFDIKTDELKKLFEMMYGLEAYYNEIKAFDLDLCFSDRGVVVCPEYRGLGIAQELLKVRRLICKDYGIPINGAWMTSYGTQKEKKKTKFKAIKLDITHKIFDVLNILAVNVLKVFTPNGVLPKRSDHYHIMHCFQLYHNVQGAKRQIT